MLDAYELIKEEYIDDIQARGTLLRHRKTGARVVLLANEDENKVFNIASVSYTHLDVYKRQLL